MDRRTWMDAIESNSTEQVGRTIAGLRLANPECLGTVQKARWTVVWRETGTDEPPDDPPAATSAVRTRPRPRPGAPGRRIRLAHLNTKERT